jgi:hypothetical protein
MVPRLQRRSVCASVCRSGVEVVGSALACRLPLLPSAPPSALRVSASSTPGWRMASHGQASSLGAVPDYCFTVDGRRMLYDVKRISFCPSCYWPTVAVASSRRGPLEHRASLVRAEYEAAAAALDARTAAWHIRTGTAVPVGAPTAVDILASFPPVRGLVFGSTTCGGSREVGILLAQAASSSAQRHCVSGARSALARRSLHARPRSFMISTLRSQVGFAAAIAYARLRLSRLELIGGSGRTAGRYASAARAFISPTAFEQARGGALGAGGGRVGFAGGGLF